MSTGTSNRTARTDGATVLCPSCGGKGDKVKRLTLESLLRPERQGAIGEDQYYVCATPRCDTVYFGASNGQTFRKPDITVRFGLKENDAPRPICYCFNHTIEEIHDEIRRTGESGVVESIKADMQDPGCRCEYTNPLGGCCLKTVQAAVADALRVFGHEEPAAATGAVAPARRNPPTRKEEHKQNEPYWSEPVDLRPCGGASVHDYLGRAAECQSIWAGGIGTA